MPGAGANDVLKTRPATDIVNSIPLSSLGIVAPLTGMSTDLPTR